jgi:hypothetical protein
VELEKDGEDLWADRVRNETASHRVKEKKNIIHTKKTKNANWIGHILCRKGLLKHIIERKTEGMRRREGRRKQLLNNLKQKRRYWYLKKELQIALSGEISLERAMELLQDRI